MIAMPFEAWRFQVVLEAGSHLNPFDFHNRIIDPYCCTRFSSSNHELHHSGCSLGIGLFSVQRSVLMTHLSLNYLCILQLFAGKSLLRCFDIRGTQTMELNSWAQGYSQFGEIYSHLPRWGDFWNDVVY